MVAEAAAAEEEEGVGASACTGRAGGISGQGSWAERQRSLAQRRAAAAAAGQVRLDAPLVRASRIRSTARAR